MTPNPALFAPILAAAVTFFAWSMYRRLGLVALGRREGATDPGTPFRNLMVRVVAQQRVLARPFGMNHLLIFWSFIVLLAVNAGFMIGGVFPSLALENLLPYPAYSKLMLLCDLASLATLAAVAAAAVRRTVSPPFAAARSLEGYGILLLIALHMTGYFGLNAARIAAGDEPAAGFMPVSSALSWLLAASDRGTLETVGLASWWLHAAALILFMTLVIPYSKHLHIFTAAANCLLRRRENPNTQPTETFEEGEVFGAGRVDLLSRRDLLDVFACAKCGRCESVCPAAATGKPLNPREMIAAIRRNLLGNAPHLRRGGEAPLPLVGSGEGSVEADALWSCTSCGACMAACPVFIEHLPKTVKMRRHLVEMKAEFPEELLNLFENIEGRGNPWGIAPSERGKWAAGVERPYVPGETDYLVFVGCAGSFDSRGKQVSAALAKVLDAAGISWGILGKEEKCCGDSLRRLGNEYAFDRIARENVELLRSRWITRIITQCPHCFTILKNDYRQYGLELEVIHHGDFIAQLLESGRLKAEAVAEAGKVVVHDSCYLGRHNDLYNAPRKALKKVTGAAPAEMTRTRENSFCCGAGGGRMWIEERHGTRINRERVRQALVEKPDTVCVSCPYCLTMFEDGLKDEKAEVVRVKDIAEIVASSL
ncbi:MAG TPA: (Fe-S)-binding protein [Verrucomicrobiae bacterium]|nr:(Fe-S)-binding protein [Verrucomicrobiae bacterium]